MTHGFALLITTTAADYDSKPNDNPIATTENRTSTYVGGQVSFAANFKKNDLQVGFLSFYQSDNQFFGATLQLPTNGDPTSAANPRLAHRRSRDAPPPTSKPSYIDDKFKPFSWLTLSAGMRPTRFAEGNFAAISDRQSPSPPSARASAPPSPSRVCVGHSAPSTDTTIRRRPLRPFLVRSDQLRAGRKVCGFIPLHGERDEEHQFGVTIPYRGWVARRRHLPNQRRQFSSTTTTSEHPTSSSPSPIAKALIRGWELTLRSPRIAHRAQLHLAYSNQIAEGSGAITGGLTDFTRSLPPEPGLCPLDHDQRNTLNVGGDVTLPWRSYASTNVYYGSGFTQRVPGRALSGRLSAAAHHLRSVARQRLRRTLLRVAQRPERRQPPRRTTTTASPSADFTGTCRAKSMSKCATGSTIEVVSRWRRTADELAT